MVQVLIVDDERSIRVTLSEFLKNEDYEVNVASDADQALEMLTAENYDVVVTDIIMPRITGVKLLKSIKETAPRVQVIMMTGEPTIETASEAVRTGAFDYLTKPIGREELVKTVANAVKIKTLDDERLRLEDENQQYQEHLEELVGERTQALRESNEQFRRAVVDSPVPIMIHDEDDNILQISKGWTEYSGYLLEDISTMSDWTEKAYGSSIGKEKAYINKLFEINETVEEGEWTITAKDGSKRIWEFKTTPLGKNARGRRLVQSMAVDITERKQAEAQLKLQSHALESAANAIIITDTEGAIEWVNPAFSALTGYSAEEVLGQNPRILKSGQNEPELYKKLWDTISSGEAWRGKIVNKHKDGTLYPEEMTIVPLVSEDGKINNFVAVKEDISERVQAQVTVQQYTSQLETLNTVTAALSTSLESEKVLDLILTQIGYVIPFDSGAIFLYEKDGLRVVADFGITPSSKGQIFPSENKLFKEIQEMQKPLALNDLDGDTRFENCGRSATLGSWMGVPLFVRDTLIGILTLDSTQSDAYSPEQADLALSFASQAAQAIENAQLFQKATQRLERMDTLRKIDQAITSGLGLNVTLNILLDQLREKLAVDAAAVLLYEKKGQILSFFEGQGFQTAWIRETNLLLGQGYAGKVALDRRDIFIQDLDQSKIRALKPDKINEEDFVSYYGVPLIAKDQLIGVLEIFHRSLLNPSDEWISFLQTLAEQAAIAIDNITLHSDLQISNKNLSLAYDATIEGWAKALELRDMEAEGHSRRVVNITIELAKTLGYSEENLAHIRRGALLHDIGKMGVPDSILQKPGKLTESEWQVMRKHPVFAYKWLSSIDYLEPALDIPYCHHEKWDGTGYPRGLVGEQIPLNARIFAVVDVWDALRSERPYKKAWSQEKTLAYIQAESAKHFDPQVVDAFIKYLDEGGGKY
ncbi:MAG: PAS domain S-box protein [Anaerolineae bacterium]|jgi:PAS domain S-box-containing protein|nr:PAS domain S-box protein [Anaerolineae bacterium]MBT4310098.1 PAS domain S-box protein [Anaerolineae bacterium]MBT4457827.1 PAS domain S-box protein [Anaerolineae bacterium]MBT6059749.1 PAS domain S-box protein [Anaerolineae bacterium]MBT6321003.1 PAS domain S-box protein [Anaerolineae bacterium]